MMNQDDLASLNLALERLWAKLGGQDDPDPAWRWRVIKTLLGESQADPLPTAHLSGGDQMWRLEATQEGLSVLATAATAHQQTLVLEDERSLSMILDPTDEATLTIREAVADLQWMAPLVWLLVGEHRSAAFRLATRRAMEQLYRVLVALQCQDELEEAS